MLLRRLSASLLLATLFGLFAAGCGAGKSKEKPGVLTVRPFTGALEFEQAGNLSDG